MKKRICIINFLTHYDWRMARQLPYITSEFDVTVVGFKEVYDPIEGVEWKFIEAKPTVLSKLWDRVMMLVGKLFPPAYDFWYWRRRRYREGLEKALETQADAYQADDWASLPIAVEAGKRKKAKAVYDAYEFWSLETENQFLWRMFFSPLIKRVEDRYIPKLDLLVTVSPQFVEMYGQNRSIKPVLITNAPESIPLPAFKPTDETRVRIVNHGSAVRDRHLERMIEAMAYVDDRFTLDFIFLPLFQDYVAELKALASKLAPGRVNFLPPVPKSEILARVAEYDVGIFIIPPVSKSYHNTLPNRFFDFIAAGLAVCVGPSPAMKEIVEQYGVGIVTPSFEAKDIAEALNRLTPEDIDRMKRASREAGRVLNARTENQKWVTLYRELLATNA